MIKYLVKRTVKNEMLENSKKIAFYTGIAAVSTVGGYISYKAIKKMRSRKEDEIEYLEYEEYDSDDLENELEKDELKEKVESKSGSLGVYYDLIFSNSKKPIGTQAVVVSDAAVIALTNEKNADKKLFETSLKDFMANDSRNVNVTLYNDEKSFLSRVSTLALSKDDSTPNMNIEKNAHSLLSMCI